jgi:hypothetical protein
MLLGKFGKDAAGEIRSKELEMDGKKRKQALMDELLQPTTVVGSSVTAFRKAGFKELDSKIASFIY